MRGVYKHNIDVKGRMSFPVKFRDEIGDSFVLTRGLGGCLWALSIAEWERLEDTIAEQPLAKAREMQYFFAANYDIDIDAQGRVLIPPPLRIDAGLGKEVTVVGFKRRVEIWDAKKWAEVSSLSGETALELMGDIIL